MVKFNFVLMFELYIFLVLLLIALGACKSLRIIGGRDAIPYEYTYIVRLVMQITSKMNGKVNWQYRCTCSVITPLWTITAAHCLSMNPYFKHFGRFFKLYNFKHMIRYGSNNRARANDSFSSVLHHQSHPSFLVRKGKFDDIALLKTEPINLSIYGRLSALDYTTIYGHEATLVGFGDTNSTKMVLEDTAALNKPLQVVKVMVNKCDFGDFPSICLIPACGEYTTLCEGDSGGPTIHPSGIIAVSSKSYVKYNCQMLTDAYRERASGFVIPISPYINWINNYISKSTENKLNIISKL